MDSAIETSRCTSEAPCIQSSDMSWQRFGIEWKWWGLDSMLPRPRLTSYLDVCTEWNDISRDPVGCQDLCELRLGNYT